MLKKGARVTVKVRPSESAEVLTVKARTLTTVAELLGAIEKEVGREAFARLAFSCNGVAVTAAVANIKALMDDDAEPDEGGFTITVDGAEVE